MCPLVDVIGGRHVKNGCPSTGGGTDRSGFLNLYYSIIWDDDGQNGYAKRKEFATIQMMHLIEVQFYEAKEVFRIVQNTGGVHVGEPIGPDYVVGA
jgi:hypothetical protein